jgi:NADPH2:quinone reductase
MQAAFYERTGPAQDVLRVGTMPVPEPGPGEVLVRVHASGVNPSDVKKRAGRMPAPAEYPRIIPHSDGAGVIEAVGEGADPARVGERVWLWNAQWKRPFGTAAELVALPEAQAVPLPEGISFAEGACLGIPAETAFIAAMEGAPAPGRTVLVHGGAGAVGELAVAIAAEAGATVIATASTAEKAAIALAAGAAEVIRYRDADTATEVLALTGGRGVDHVVDVDFGANWRVNAAVLATNGTIAAYSAPSRPVFEIDYYAFAAKAARLRFVQVYLLPPEERRRCIAGIGRLLGAGRLPIRIARSFPLEEIVAAHRYQESGQAVGNIIIDIAGGDHAHP